MVNSITPARAATTYTISPPCRATIGDGGDTWGDVNAVPGDIIKLGANVGPCLASTGTTGLTDFGLKLGVGGVTLDLNGKRVLGCNRPEAVTGCNAPNLDPNNGGPTDGAYTYGSGAGILVESLTGVTITDASAVPVGARRSCKELTGGGVSYWDQGILLIGGGSHIVKDTCVSHNVGKVTSASPPRGEGISIDQSSNNKIQNNLVNNNGPYAGIILLGAGTSGNIIGSGIDVNNDLVDGGGVQNCTNAAGNELDDNNTMTNGLTFQDDGIRIEPGVSSTLVGGNTVQGSSLDGIAVFHNATGNKVVGNCAIGNGFGYATGPADGDQLPWTNDEGPWQPHPSRLGDGIRLFGIPNSTTPTGGNVVKHNVTCANAGNGIVVTSQNNTRQHKNDSGSMDTLPTGLRSPVIVGTAPGAFVQNGSDSRCLPNGTYPAPITGTRVPYDSRRTAFDVNDPDITAPCTNTWTETEYGTHNLSPAPHPCVPASTNNTLLSP